jgi:glucose/arabinose dehydrogenase
MLSRLVRLATAGAVAVGVSGVIAAAANAQPLPTSSNGSPVALVASGLGTPTSFAFGDGAVFEGDGGNSTTAIPNGGVFLLRDGTATRLADSPQFVAGLAWHDNALYISGGSVTATGAVFVLARWSGWNGSSFTHRQILYVAPPGFDGANGIAFGANGRLYVGVDVGLTDGNDHGPASLTPGLYDIVTFNANGGDLQVFATGIRQPWQMAFLPGSNDPFVSDLGQDADRAEPLDYLLHVSQGQNYGFPDAVPGSPGTPMAFQSFAPHTDVMGVAIFGSHIFLSEFGAAPPARSPQVVSIPLTGGTPNTLLSGFVAPIVGLGIHNDRLYVGELTGDVYSVRVAP